MNSTVDQFGSLPISVKKLRYYIRKLNDASKEEKTTLKFSTMAKTVDVYSYQSGRQRGWRQIFGRADFYRQDACWQLSEISLKCQSRQRSHKELTVTPTKKLFRNPSLTVFPNNNCHIVLKVLLTTLTQELHLTSN